MSEEVHERSLEDPLDVEGVGDEFSRRAKANIRYTIAWLLEFSDAEICRKLPSDFDVLILRQLNGESDGLIEHKKICCSSSSSCPSTKWNMEFPGENFVSQFCMPKESDFRGNCNSDSKVERYNITCQFPLEFGNNAAILGRNFPRSDLFQLRKSENPYRPPNKKIPQTIETSDLQVECSGNSSYSAVETSPSVSTDSLTEIGSINTSPDNSWRNNERSGVLDAKFELGMTEDNRLFDDFWTEILEIIQLQQEPNFTPLATYHNIPDKNSQIPANGSASGNLNFITHDDLAYSQAEIALPDEDSLISIDDIIIPQRSMPEIDQDFQKADKCSSNLAGNIGKISRTAYANESDEGPKTISGKEGSKMIGVRGPSILNSPGPISHGIQLPQLPHSLISDTFSTESSFLYTGNDHTSLLSEFTTPNRISYPPALNCYSLSNFPLQPNKEHVPTRVKCNDSLVHYSLLQQPNIHSEQLNRLLVDIRPMKQVVAPDFNAMQVLHLQSQQAIHQGIGMSTTGKQYSVQQYSVHFIHSSKHILFSSYFNITILRFLKHPIE